MDGRLSTPRSTHGCARSTLEEREQNARSTLEGRLEIAETFIEDTLKLEYHRIDPFSGADTRNEVQCTTTEATSAM